MASRAVNIPSEIVQQLRKSFQKRYHRHPPEVPFHEADLERIRNMDAWLKRFLKNQLNVKAALTKLWNTCIWRQDFGVNDLSELNLSSYFLQLPIIYARNHDIDGFPLLIFQCRHHDRKVKDKDEFVRVVVYWIERVQRTNNMLPITLVFDLTDTGLRQMDVEFLSCIISLFRAYYPASLHMIIVHELPWALYAPFCLIKQMLPRHTLDMIRVTSKSDITKYIDEDNCLTSWGGNDDYQYSFEPENKSQGSSVENRSRSLSHTCRLVT